MVKLPLLMTLFLMLTREKFSDCWAQTALEKRQQSAHLAALLVLASLIALFLSRSFKFQ
jgi:hypothetical protein